MWNPRGIVVGWCDLVVGQPGIALIQPPAPIAGIDIVLESVRVLRYGRCQVTGFFDSLAADLESDSIIRSQNRDGMSPPLRRLSRPSQPCMASSGEPRLNSSLITLFTPS